MCLGVCGVLEVSAVYHAPGLPVVCVLSAVSAVSVHAAVAPTIELDPARPGTDPENERPPPPLSRFFSRKRRKKE